MTDTPLNPDALVSMARIHFESGRTDHRKWEHLYPEIQDTLIAEMRPYAEAVLAVAQPVVNSVEELDALPPHTVIEEREQGHGVLIKRGPRSWECLTHYVSGLPSGDIDLPARVLYRPTEESTNGR